MGEINSNQEQNLNNSNNLQEVNQFYNNSNNTYTNSQKKIPTKYIIGASILIILCGVTFGFSIWTFPFIFPLLWLIYWIFKFYKKVSWKRYSYSIASLIIIGVLGGLLTYNWFGSNMWNFLPVIYTGVIFALLIIWSAIIVPIFILYHRIKNKDKLNNVDINTQNNYSDNINQLNPNRNINIAISIFLILFLLFIFNSLFSVFLGETLWEVIVNGIHFIWSWIFVYSR